MNARNYMNLDSFQIPKIDANVKIKMVLLMIVWCYLVTNGLRIGYLACLDPSLPKMLTLRRP